MEVRGSKHDAIPSMRRHASRLSLWSNVRLTRICRPRGGICDGRAFAANEWLINFAACYCSAKRR